MKTKKAEPVVVTKCPICKGKRLIVRSEVTAYDNGAPQIYCCDCRQYIGYLAGKVIRTGD